MSIVEELGLYMDAHNLKLPKVAELTGIPYDRIYKWIRTGAQPKADDYQTLREFMDGRKESLVEESQPRYLPHSHVTKPDSCMDTLAKAMEVILSQQKTIQSQLSLLQQYVPGAQPNVA